MSERLTPEDDYILNLETHRMAVHRPFGIALYEQLDLKSSEGTHQGITGSEKAAEEWVRGGELPADLIKVHGPRPS